MIIDEVVYINQSQWDKLPQNVREGMERSGTKVVSDKEWNNLGRRMRNYARIVKPLGENPTLGEIREAVTAELAKHGYELGYAGKDGYCLFPKDGNNESHFAMYLLNCIGEALDFIHGGDKPPAKFIEGGIRRIL